MKTRLYHLWDKLTSSYWFVPSLMLSAAAGLAVRAVMIRVPRSHFRLPISEC